MTSKPPPMPAPAEAEGIEVLMPDAPGNFGGGLTPFPSSDGVSISEGVLMVMSGDTQLAVFAPGAWLIAARPSVMRQSLMVVPADGEDAE